MNTKKGQQKLPPDLRVFLAEVGEAVKEYLETKHKESRRIQGTPEDGEEGDESSRLLSG